MSAALSGTLTGLHIAGWQPSPGETVTVHARAEQSTEIIADTLQRVLRDAGVQVRTAQHDRAEIVLEGEHSTAQLSPTATELALPAELPAPIQRLLVLQHRAAETAISEQDIRDAERRYEAWRAWAAAPNEDPSLDESVLEWLRVTLAADLDTPAAVQAVDSFIRRAPAADESIAAIDALLGIQLR